MKTKPLSQQTALVTGGGTGIGRAFTEALATAGVRVVIASRRRDVLEQTAGEINNALGNDASLHISSTFATALRSIRSLTLLPAIVGPSIS